MMKMKAKEETKQKPEDLPEIAWLKHQCKVI
jgi:hypothetical protein